MPIIVSDTFTVGANASLNGRVPNTGSAWAYIGGGGDNVQAIATTDTAGPTTNLTNSWNYYLSAPSPAVDDYDVAFTLTTLATGATQPIWLLSRFVDATDDYYAAGIYPGGAAADKKLVRYAGGVGTEIGSGDTGTTANDVFSLEIRTGTQTLKRNGSTILSASDTALTAIGACGIGFGWVGTASADDVSSTWRFDNYTVTTIDAAGRPLQSRRVSMPINPALLGV
jgi:hypothetical protein